MEAYEARAFRFIELLTISDWRMKLYGIAWRRESPRAQLLEAAKRIAAEELRNAAPNNYKLGFIGCPWWQGRMLRVRRLLGERERIVPSCVSLAFQ